MTNLKTTTVENNDVYSVALLHKKLFKDHYLGGFSVSLLEKFYLSFLCENITFIVCTDTISRELAGFVVGGDSKDLAKAKNAFLKTSKFRIFFEILFKPKMWTGTFERFINISQTSDKDRSELSFRLLSIGVNEKFQGKGVAIQLINKFEQTLKNQNIYQYGLSVHSDNFKAIKFYEKNCMIVEKKTTTTIFFIKKIVY